MTFWHSTGILRNFMQLRYFTSKWTNASWITSVENAHHLDEDPDPSIYFNADPDPARHQSEAYLRPLVLRSSTAPFCACKPPLWASLVLYVSILSLHGFWIWASMRIWIRLFTLIRIRIRNIVNNIKIFKKTVSKIKLYKSCCSPRLCKLKFCYLFGGLVLSSNRYGSKSTAPEKMKKIWKIIISYPGENSWDCWRQPEGMSSSRILHQRKLSEITGSEKYVSFCLVRRLAQYRTGTVIQTAPPPPPNKGAVLACLGRVANSIQQGFGSVLIWYGSGSGSSILGWIPIRIRIPNPDPGFWWPKIVKNL